MSRWYDGCLGWIPTFERIHTVEFSLPYMKIQEVDFYVIKEKQAQFDPSDVTGKKIGEQLSKVNIHTVTDEQGNVNFNGHILIDL